MAEPKNCFDLRYMIESSNASNGIINYESHKGVEVGDPMCYKTIVSTSFANVANDKDGIVNVYHVTDRLSDIYAVGHNGLPNSYSTRAETDWRETFTFDEFKDSEYWPLAMEAFKSGNPDSSQHGLWVSDGWENDIQHDFCEEVFVGFNVPKCRTDWGNNDHILGSSVDGEFIIDRLGFVRLSLGKDERWRGHICELMNQINELQSYKDAGVRLNVGEVVVRIGENK